MKKYLALMIILAVTIAYGQGTGLVKPTSGSGVTSTALAAIADPGADDKVIVSSGAATAVWTALPASPQNGPIVTQSSIYDSNTNTFSSREAAASTASGKRYSFCWQGTDANSSLSCWGEGNPSNVGTSPVLGADATTFTRAYLTLTTKVGTPTSGDVAGQKSSVLTGGFSANTAAKMVIQMATSADTSNQRIWAGMMSADTSATASNTTNAAIRIVAFAYDTGASDTSWKFVTCVGSGAANTCTTTDTTLAVTASHQYIMTIDYSAGTSPVYYRITDQTTGVTRSGNVATNLPTSTSLNGWQVTVTTLTGAQRAVWLASTSVEQN